MSDSPVSRTQVKLAGDILRTASASEDAKKAAMENIAAWRRLHAYPLLVINMWIRWLALRHADQPVVAQRLKRMPSIIKKIRRFPSMDVSRLQDIGGVRVILKDIGEVYDIYKKIENSTKRRHDLVLPPKDYIEQPKPDGYRSLHQVFKYHGRQATQYDNLRIELQLRTQLQHAWATAVEILEVVEKASFKAGEGGERFKRFFQLTSALFAVEEQQPVPEACAHTPAGELVQELEQIDSEIHAFAKLRMLTASVSNATTNSPGNGYTIFVLKTDNNGKHELNTISMGKKYVDIIDDAYTSLEEKYINNDNVSVLLMSTTSAREFKKAFPNYYLDASMFLSRLEQIRGRYHMQG